MTEVAIRQPAAALDVASPAAGPLDDWLRVLTEVVRLAEVVCQSAFVPAEMRGNAPATAAAILAARELGIPPMTGLANIHVIKGKTGLSALMMRALILAQGHEWKDVEVSDKRVAVRGRRKGEQDWTEAEFTIEQAKVAGIQSNGYPQDKLYARATCRLARRKFADVIAGMPYSAEELADGDFGDLADDRRRTGADGITASKPTQTSAAVPDELPGSGPAAAEPHTPGPAASAAPAGPGAKDVPGPPQETQRHPAGGDGGPGTRKRLTKPLLGRVQGALHALPLGSGSDVADVLTALAGRPVQRADGLYADEAERVLKVIDEELEASQGETTAAAVGVRNRAKVLLAAQEQDAAAEGRASGE